MSTRDSDAVTIGMSAYDEVRGLTEALAAPLSPEDQTVQSMPDTSPTKWHRAHTSWFFETFLLEPQLDGYRAFDESYRYLFNSYYEAVGPRHARPERGLLSRPGAAEIGRYRAHVDAGMRALLELPLAPAVDELVTLGLHHEQQHQELLLMDIKHVLSVNPLQPGYAPRAASVTAARTRPSTGWIEHAGGIVEIGAPDTGFSFDNEHPRHEALLQPFELATNLVTCGDWLEFVEDGGYQRAELWLSDGWTTVNAEGWEGPLYWSEEARQRTVFTLAGPRPLHPADPVCHVSYYEADAFARWSGARLPSEAEWEAVATAAPPTAAPRYLDLDVLHPLPAPDTVGVHQLLGDVWEWTASPYGAYPGFRPAPGAVGEYNGKFMVNQYVLRGGSCLTPAGHVRPSYRNFFPAGARWPMTGLRLARDLPR